MSTPDIVLTGRTIVVTGAAAGLGVAEDSNSDMMLMRRALGELG